MSASKDPANRVDVARNVFSRFLEIVVRDHVFSDAERTRASGPLNETVRKDIDAKKRIDGRAPFLTAISGKGGWHPDPATAEDRARWSNVSLLDHICSVVRGALVFAELDLSATGVAEPDLKRRLAIIAAIAFLHDADKIVGKRSDGRSLALSGGRARLSLRHRSLPH